MVAECRYAETGVGAAIAWGSQKWKGNCADLVNTPSRISISTSGYRAWARISSPAARTSVSSKLPAMWPSSSTRPATPGRPSGNGQGHPRTLAGVGTAAPEADEQERGQAGQLPEEHHQQEIFREHHAEHGAHEQQQESEETPHRLLFGEVVAGVEDHQQADAEDQQGEEETEAVQAQAEVDADFRQPGIAGGQGLPANTVPRCPSNRIRPISGATPADAAHRCGRHARQAGATTPP